MLNSPAMQMRTTDPEIIRSVIETNPQLRDLMDRNPELRHVMSDPETLGQTFEIARNPDLMREQMRTTDRAMSNLETHPEGFNALRRMYENFQEPLMNATTTNNANSAASNAASNPFAALRNQGNQQQGANGGAGTPLPNPWAPQPQQQGTNRQAGGGAAGAGGNGGTLPAGGIPPIPPALLQTMMNANPEMRQMMDANPQMRQVLNDPNFLRQMADPANIQAMMQMQQAMQQLRGSGLMGGLGDTGGMGGMGGMGNPFGALGGGFPGAGAGGNSTPPEELYASQLTQLQEMGFHDQQANIRALSQVGGNVNAAVDRLLSGL